MAIATRPMTEEEFLRLPDDGKYELVDGEAVKVPTTLLHDVIGSNIVALMRPIARGRGYVTISQAGYRMANRNIRCPDVAYTAKERFPGGLPPNSFGDFAPDIAIEIISPSENRRDMDRKVREYFASGAKQVWHLFPETVSARIFTSPDDFQSYTAEAEVSAGDLLPGLRCKVGDLFSLE